MRATEIACSPVGRHNGKYSPPASDNNASGITKPYQDRVGRLAELIAEVDSPGAGGTALQAMVDDPPGLSLVAGDMVDRPLVPAATVKQPAVFLTGPVARRLAPKKPTSVRWDGFLYSSGKRVEDDHRLCEGFDDRAKSRLAA